MDRSTVNIWFGEFSVHLLYIHLLPFICFPQDGDEGEAPVRVLMKADPSCRESRQTEAEGDPLDGEQTWPTESELLEAEGPKSLFLLNGIFK